MARFTATEASLYNGISQQSPELRLPSQVTFVEDADLTVSRGIERRPPVQHIVDWESYYDSQTLVHSVPFDNETMYFAVIAGPTSTRAHQIMDQDGTEYPIRYTGDTQAYLESVDDDEVFNPIEALQLTTILDFTFVCNKNVVPAMSDVLEPVNLPRGYLWVSNGVQEVDRSITINGVTHTHVKDTNNDTKIIIDYFETEVNGQVGFTSIRISDSVLKVVPADDLPFTFTSTDSYGDTTMEVSLTEGTKFESLPPRATDAQVMTITPETNTDAKYYLQYNASTKIWSEVSAPEETSGFDLTTMPHAFIRNIDDQFGTVTGIPLQVYFNLETIPYVARTSGGIDSSPEPSFIGKKIADTFFFKNRLGFIAGENIILSATDDLFRFWPTTVKEVLDDDPIDVSISSTKSVTLSHVSPFPESLIIVGDNEQFSLGSGGKAFTPENAILDPTTTYSASRVVAPVAMGSTMYFIAPQSNFAAVREYAVQPDTLVTDAADVTGHVSQLIPNNVKQLIAEPNLEYLFLVSKDEYDDDNAKSIFVYKFFWQGNEKVQSAWQSWNFWFNPVGGAVFNGQLYMLGTECTDDDTLRTVFTRINLNDNPSELIADDNLPYKMPLPNLDRQSFIPDDNVTYGNNTLTLEVTESQYELFDIKDTEFVLTDRIVGTSYEFISRFITANKFYITFGIPYPTTDLGDLECLVLGNYTTGGCEPFVPVVIPAVFYNTFGFNGTSQLVNVSDTPSLQITTNVSLFAWVNTNELTTGIFISKASGGGPLAEGYRLGMQLDGKCQMVISSTGDYLSFTAPEDPNPAVIGEWIHYAGIYNGSTVKIYRDGIEVASSAWTAGIFDNGLDVKIGAMNGASANHYEGSLCQPTICNDAISESDLLLIVNGGKGLDYSDWPSTVTDVAVMAPELTSKDNTMLDLSTGGNNGTAVGGVTSNGELIEWDS